MTIPRRRSTGHEHADRLVAGAVALIAVLATPTGPLPAQQLIELPAEDTPLDADFEEVYRLGTLDGGGWDTFGNIEGLGFDGGGNLYILDTRAVRISVVDPEGKLVRRFIGEGEGPGEFGSNSARGLNFAVMRDGRVAVYDPGRASNSPSLAPTASSNARSPWAATAGASRCSRTFGPSREWSGCSPRPGSPTSRHPIRGRDPGSGTY